MTTTELVAQPDLEPGRVVILCNQVKIPLVLHSRPQVVPPGKEVITKGFQAGRGEEVYFRLGIKTDNGREE